jgi:hypothetical protein
MIIKSMSRKEPSFAQLIDYMSDVFKVDTKFHVYHNLFSRNDEQIKAAFQENARLVRKRKNANYMYHEILSITKSKQLDIEAQKTILREIAYEYIQMRAGKNMVFGCVHNDHAEHLHYHLLISANEAYQKKKTRLTKSQFNTIKKQIEENVLARYPELEQTMVINRRPSAESKAMSGESMSRKAGEQKRRTGKIPQRDAVKAKLHQLFEQVQSKADFFTRLSAANLELYCRGKYFGVKNLRNNRKHRLQTLGLMDEFTACCQRIGIDELHGSSTHTEQSKPLNDKEQTSANNIRNQQRKRKAEIDGVRKRKSRSRSQRKTNKP